MMPVARHWAGQPTRCRTLGRSEIWRGGGCNLPPGPGWNRVSCPIFTPSSPIIIPSSPHCQPIVAPSSPHRRPMVSPWSPHGRPIVAPSSPHRRPIVAPSSPHCHPHISHVPPAPPIPTALRRIPTYLPVGAVGLGGRRWPRLHDRGVQMRKA